MLPGQEETGPLTHGWWGCTMPQAFWKAVQQLLIKLNSQIYYNTTQQLHPWAFIPEK